MTANIVTSLIGRAMAQFNRSGIGSANVCDGEVIVSLEITTTDERTRRYAISVKANRATREMVSTVLDNDAIKELVEAVTAAAKEQAK
jgi:hypothetical protein